MSHLNLHMETLAIPPEAEKTAKKEHNWMLPAAPNIMVHIWHHHGGLPAFFALGGDNAEGYKYGLSILFTGKPVEPLKNGLAAYNPNFDIADYFCERFDEDATVVALDGRDALHVLLYNDELYIWITEREHFRHLLRVCSSLIRDLAKGTLAQLDEIFETARANKAALWALPANINAQRELLPHYPGLPKQVDGLLGRWGLCEEMAPVLAAAACALAPPELQTVCTTHQVPAALERSPVLREELFLQFQREMVKRYVGFRGLATKEYLESTVVAVAKALAALGYGLYPNGLATLVRAFEIDFVDGVPLALYQSNAVYDVENFGYYDSIANETHYDKIWRKIDVDVLIQPLHSAKAF